MSASKNNNLEMQELYQEVILDHNRHPKNFKKLDDFTFHIEGNNPFCGDHYEVYIKLNESKDVIQEITYEGQGCAISKASGSIMTEILTGKNITEVENLFDLFHKLITNKLNPEENNELGKLKVFSNVKNYPSRIKCAILCWHTMHSALKGLNKPVTTE